MRVLKGKKKLQKFLLNRYIFPYIYIYILYIYIYIYKFGEYYRVVLWFIKISSKIRKKKKRVVV
jgi:hypothetical protein